MSRLQEKFVAYSSALKRLNEAIEMYKKENNAILLDGTIQRFEFTVELGWKLMKQYLEDEKFGEFNSPKSTVKEAYRVGIIEDGEQWLDMLDDRNLTSHTYDEEVAKEIYRNILTRHIEILMKLEEKLKSEIEDE